MDSLSLAAAASSFLGVIIETSSTIASFVRSYHEARDDLAPVNRELSDLRLTAEVLVTSTEEEGGHPNEKAEAIPSKLRDLITEAVQNCTTATGKIKAFLEKYLDRGELPHHAWDGKETIESLRTVLETQKASLDLTRKLASLMSRPATKATSPDTTVAYRGVEDINEDTVGLRQQISKVWTEIAKLRVAVVAMREHESGVSDECVAKWLDSLTSYAEMTCGDNSHVPPRVNGNNNDPRASTSLTDCDTRVDEADPPLKAEKGMLIRHRTPIQFIHMWGNLLAATDLQNQIIVWDAYTGQQLASFKSCNHRFSKPVANLRGIYFLANPDYLCTYDSKCGAVVWNWKKGQRQLQVAPDEHIQKVLISCVYGGGSSFAVCWINDKNELWRAKTPKWKKTLLAVLPPKVVFFSGSGDRLAVLLTTGELLWVDAETGAIESRASPLCFPRELQENCELLVGRPAENRRVTITARNSETGTIVFRTWDRLTGAITPIQLEGYSRPDTLPPVMTWLVAGKLNAIFFAEWVDIVNVLNGSKWRLTMPFSMGSKQDFHFNLHSKLIKVKVEPQLRINMNKERRMLATKTDDQAIQLWELDLDVDNFLR